MSEFAIPRYIKNRYAEFRRGEYGPGFRPEIKRLMDEASWAGSRIRPTILFLLATLLVLAREKHKETVERYAGDRARKTANRAMIFGFTHKSHALRVHSPEKAIATSRSALAALHKSASGLKISIERFAAAYDRHKPALPAGPGLEKDIADLRRSEERIRYWTDPQILQIEHSKLKRTTATKIALIWWCFLHPNKHAGFDDIYELGQIWGLTKAESKKNFSRNLWRLVRDAEAAGGVDTYLWFVPTDEMHTISSIRLPTDRTE